MRRALLCALALALGNAAARAGDVQVLSPQADSVSVTIYRDLFALITETRTVDLPDGPVTLVFEGVVDSLIPASAVVAETGREARENNFDFELLTPAALLRKNIGREVLLMRTNPGTGKVRQVPARVIAANTEGVIFRTTEGNEALQCSGLPEQLSYEEVPGDLHSRPRLSIRLAAGAPGRRQVRLSYLAHGFAWQADYVGRLTADAPRMDLLGWITLHNFTRTGFRGAQVQVVAGRLNLLGFDEDGGTSLVGATSGYSIDEFLDEAREELVEAAREDPDEIPGAADALPMNFGGCYPLGTTVITEDLGRLPDVDLAEALMRVTGIAAEDIEEIVVTGFRASIAARENLADYQLYRLPEPTDLAARQTKQVVFLQKEDVTIERFYGLRITDGIDYDDLGEVDGNFIPVDVRVAWRNRTDDGLGEPLPGGVVRFFESAGTGQVFAGDAKFRDTPVGEPVELTIAKSLDLGVTFEGTADEPEVSVASLITRRVHLPVHVRIYNDKPRKAVVEIRQGPPQELENFRVVGASARPGRKSGDYVWRIDVPAAGERTLSYKVSGRVPDWMR